MDILAGSRRRRDRTLPRRLHAGFCAGGTNGLQAGQGFNENAVTRRGFGLQSLHRAIERTLQDKADHDHERQHAKRNPRQRSSDNKENPDEEHGKDQIGCRHHAAGGEELARRIEVAKLVGNDADRSRPLRHFHRHHMFEDVGGKNHVHGLSGHVNHAASHRAKHKIEHDGEAHPDR